MSQVIGKLKAYQSRHRSTTRCAALLREVHGSAEWTALEDQRGQDFHRWRVESSPMAGTDPGGGFWKPMLYAGRQIGVMERIEPAPYTYGDGIEQRVIECARAALVRLSETMLRLATEITKSVEPLAQGQYRPFDTGGFSSV